MQKSKVYKSTLFSAEILQKAIDQLDGQGSGAGLRYNALSVQVDDSNWRYDEPPQFWADYRKRAVMLTWRSEMLRSRSGR